MRWTDCFMIVGCLRNVEEEVKSPRLYSCEEEKDTQGITIINYNLNYRICTG